MVVGVIILSIIQGVTEFLPISSSAHLLLLPWLLNFPNPGLAFDAAIHIGTALALLILFGREFHQLIKNRNKLVWYILIASLPAALAGFLGDKLIEQYFHSASFAPLIVGIGLILFSLVMYFVDKNATLQKDINHIGVKRALIIGFAQALALIPGTSRAGITITAGEYLGLTREAAARFSFLLATPISLGAGFYKFLQLLNNSTSDKVSVGLTVLGIIISFITGIVVITWLLNYLKKHSLLVFVVYRIILGLFVVILWLMKV